MSNFYTFKPKFNIIEGPVTSAPIGLKLDSSWENFAYSDDRDKFEYCNDLYMGYLTLFYQKRDSYLSEIPEFRRDLILATRYNILLKDDLEFIRKVAELQKECQEYLCDNIPDGKYFFKDDPSLNNRSDVKRKLEYQTFNCIDFEGDFSKSMIETKPFRVEFISRNFQFSHRDKKVSANRLIGKSFLFKPYYEFSGIYITDYGIHIDLRLVKAEIVD